MENIQLKTERIKAISTIVITAIINIVNVFGYAVDADIFINAATSILSAGSIFVCWWFNQNMTKAAVKGQKVLNEEKAKEKDDKEETDDDRE